MTTSITLAAAAAAEAGEASAQAGGGGLPQFDPSSFPGQLFWLAVTFGFLYWIMSTVILPRLGGVIEERRDRIADDLDQAAEFRHEAEAAEAAYKRALADARAKAQAIAAETRDELDAEIAELEAEAEAKAAAAVETAEARIAEMKSQAAEKVSEAARETTRAIVEALIDERPTDDAVADALVAAQ